MTGPSKQEDGQMWKYTILPLCPELVLAMTTVTLPVPAQRRLSISIGLFIGSYFSVITVSILII